MRAGTRERGTGVLFVTHNPVLAARCDRMVQAVDGRIQAWKPLPGWPGAKP